MNSTVRVATSSLSWVCFELTDNVYNCGEEWIDAGKKIATVYPSCMKAIELTVTDYTLFQSGHGSRYMPTLQLSNGGHATSLLLTAGYVCQL